MFIVKIEEWSEHGSFTLIVAHFSQFDILITKISREFGFFKFNLASK